jgi:histidinol phosphatase-like enzyme
LDKDLVNCTYNKEAWCDNPNRNMRKRFTNTCVEFRSTSICAHKLPVKKEGKAYKKPMIRRIN